MRNVVINTITIVGAISLGALGMHQWHRLKSRPGAASRPAIAERVKAAASCSVTPQRDPQQIPPIPRPAETESKIGGVSATPFATPVTGSAQLSDPDAARRADAGFQVEKLYGDFLQELAMKGGNAALFRDMLIERQLIGSDILAAGRAQGINMMNRESSKGLREMMSRSLKDFNAEMRTAVGETDYQAWQESERIKPDRNTAKELVRRLADTPYPISADQRAQVILALSQTTDASGWKQILSIPDEDGAPISRRVISEAALQRIRPLLIPQQFAKLEEIYAEQHRIWRDTRGQR